MLTLPSHPTRQSLTRSRRRRRWLGALAVAAAVILSGCTNVPAPPSVLQTTGAVIKLSGRSALAPEVPAVLAYTSLSDPDRARDNAERRGLPADHDIPQPFLWRGDRLTFVDEGPTLIAKGSAGPLMRVDLRGLPFLREVQGATASLDGNGDWLVLLLHFRATSRREMILIYNPEGKLVHQELMVRSVPGLARLLSIAGPAKARQEVVVNLGDYYRFAVPEPGRP